MQGLARQHVILTHPIRVVAVDGPRSAYGFIELLSRRKHRESWHRGLQQKDAQRLPRYHRGQPPNNLPMEWIYMCIYIIYTY